MRVLRGQFPGRVDRHRCASGDFDGDGRADIFCVVGGDSGNGPKTTPNELWIQQANGSFVNEGGRPGLADPWGRGRQPLVFDANGDGRPDVLVGNVSPRSDGKPSPDRLFLNGGAAGWRSAPGMGLDVPYSVGGAGSPGSEHGGGNWPMGCLAALDFNADHATDVLMCAKSPSDTTQSLHLFENLGDKKFRDVSAQAGLGGVVALDAVVADMNGDGRPDIVAVDGRRMMIFLATKAMKYTLGHQRSITLSQRVAVADADGDRRPDIYVMRTQGAPAPDVPDLLLLHTAQGYQQLTLPTVPGNVRDDEVYPVDLDHDGKSEFVVLHGHSLNPGPVQVIELSG